MGKAKSTAPKREDKVAPTCTVEQALQDLQRATEKHRLTFLYFAVAIRHNPMYTPSKMDASRPPFPQPGREMVCADHIPVEDDEGEFLFKYRRTLELFAQDALDRFGLGSGRKPRVPLPDGAIVEVEGGQLPIWLVGDIGCTYLEQSADAILASCKSLARIDKARRFQLLVQEAKDATHDQGQPTWHCSIGVRWEYLSQLDRLIASIKTADLKYQDEPLPSAGPPDKASRANGAEPSVEAARDNEVPASNMDWETLEQTLPDEWNLLGAAPDTGEPVTRQKLELAREFATSAITQGSLIVNMSSTWSFDREVKDEQATRTRLKQFQEYIWQEANYLHDMIYSLRQNLCRSVVVALENATHPALQVKHAWGRSATTYHELVLLQLRHLYHILITGSADTKLPFPGDDGNSEHIDVDYSLRYYAAITRQMRSLAPFNLEQIKNELRTECHNAARALPEIPQQGSAHADGQGTPWDEKTEDGPESGVGVGQGNSESGSAFSCTCSEEAKAKRLAVWQVARERAETYIKNHPFPGLNELGRCRCDSPHTMRKAIRQSSPLQRSEAQYKLRNPKSGAQRQPNDDPSRYVLAEETMRQLIEYAPPEQRAKLHTPEMREHLARQTAEQQAALIEEARRQAESRRKASMRACARAPGQQVDDEP